MQRLRELASGVPNAKYYTTNTKNSLTSDVLKAKNFGMNEQYDTNTNPKKKLFIFSLLSHTFHLSVPCVSLTQSLILFLFHSLPLSLTLSTSPCYHCATPPPITPAISPRWSPLPCLHLAKPYPRCQISLSLSFSELWVCCFFIFAFFFWDGFQEVNVVGWQLFVVVVFLGCMGYFDGYGLILIGVWQLILVVLVVSIVAVGLDFLGSFGGGFGCCYVGFCIWVCFELCFGLWRMQWMCGGYGSGCWLVVAGYGNGR